MSILLEFVVIFSDKINNTKFARKKLRKLASSDSSSLNSGDASHSEMTCCWAKIPMENLTKSMEVIRVEEELCGGTMFAPVDIEKVALKKVW